MLLDPETVAQLNQPAESARIVGLHYVTDNVPGIRRECSGGEFRFRDPRGKLVRKAATLRRIKSLAIPPAWTDVWIAVDPDGHLQATGRDQRRRKQHRYHPRWREIRDETKYARMIAFARVLPQIRKRVERDLSLQGLPRNKVLATVVRLLELSLIRVGNDEYARENESFGLTTMRVRHVDVNGSLLRFHFRGKAGKWHDVDIHDRRLARIVRSCQELPGQELFQFVDDNGERQDVRSGDVNGYLREISGADFTAKDFRTWAGSVLAAMALREFERVDDEAQAKRNITQAIEAVAQRLGNTPAICRKCYVHPHVIDSFLDGTLARTLKRPVDKEMVVSTKSLRQEERAVLDLLQHRVTIEEKLAASLRKESKRRRKHNRS